MASLRTLDASVAPFAARFVRALAAAGVRVTVTSARRGLAEQTRLYQQYKAGKSKYPAAAPGKSLHGIGIAFDLNLDPPVYDLVGQLWERLGYTWGGRFGDRIHFDFRPHR